MAISDWRRIHLEANIVDLHVHPSMQQQLFNRNLNMRYILNRTIHGNPMSVRASFPRLKFGGFDLILSTLFVPEQGLEKDFPILNWFRFLRPDLWKKLIIAKPFDATLAIMGDMEKAVSASAGFESARMASTVKQLDAILALPKEERPIAVIHSIEGGHSLGMHPTTPEQVLLNLENLYQRGAIYLTLAHFYPNQVVHPCYPFPEDIARLTVHPTLWRDVTQGLTPLGIQVVERMIELGMLIDLTHSTPAARKQVYDIVDASRKRVPILATHVGAYEINPSPYNLADWEIKRIARDGGVMGVIFMPYWLMPKESGQGINFISRHIQYIVNTAGENAVGIGTDFDGFTTPPDDLDNAAELPRLTQRLYMDGHSEERIKKILGGNALRAIHEGWGKKE